LGSRSGSNTWGRSLAGTATPAYFVRITPETAPNCTQRSSSSGVSRLSPSAKKPPMSEPQTDTPDRPIVSPFLIAESRPSKPHVVVGSPPQTICEQRAAPVQPERTWRAIGFGTRRT
jgi:hypothetical protein